jgi:CheY-like chemotaxis protein
VKKILIVDDEPFVREALKRVLECASVEVEVADSAESALERAATHRIDLVIVDIIMPGMDGVQFIRALRAQRADLHIIAISGGGNFAVGGYRPDSISTQAYLAAATQAGADAVLAKPFEISELEAVVQPMFAARESPPLH